MTSKAQATSFTPSQNPLIAAGWFAIAFVGVVSSLVTLGQSLCWLAKGTRHGKALCIAPALYGQPIQSQVLPSLHI